MRQDTESECKVGNIGNMKHIRKKETKKKRKKRKKEKKKKMNKENTKNLKMPLIWFKYFYLPFGSRNYVNKIQISVSNLNKKDQKIKKYTLDIKEKIEVRLKW